MGNKNKALALTLSALTVVTVFFVIFVVANNLLVALLGTLAATFGLLFIALIGSKGQNQNLHGIHSQQQKIVRDLSKVAYRTEHSRDVAGSVGKLRQNAQDLLALSESNRQLVKTASEKHTKLLSQTKDEIQQKLIAAKESESKALDSFSTTVGALENQIASLSAVVDERIPERPRPTKPTGKRTLKNLKVAFVSDEFTFNSFEPELDILVIEPDNWQQIFNENHIDFFFCESAWSGIDSITRPWMNKILETKDEAENRVELFEILDFCNKHDIPTVFWNKEDPVHYEDRNYNFVDTASRFDHIFTTDEGTVERYVKDFGHKSVHTLGFAVQPRLYNPLGTASAQRSENILFAGSWYSYHTERSAVMRQILDALLERGHGLKIFDRSWNIKVQNRRWPEKYLSFVAQGISHAALASEFKKYKYGLNFNTVTESSTMFARRIFELSASNLAVITNWSKGVEEIFGDNVLFADRRPELLDLLGTEELEKRTHTALVTSLKYHTYQHRAIEIVKVLGLDVVLPRNEIYLLQLANAESDLPILKQQREQLGDSIAGATVVLNFAGTSTFSWNTLDDGTNYITAPVLENELVDTRAFLPTDYAIIADASTQLDAQAVSEATAHTQYAEHPVSVLESKHRFEYGFSDSAYGLVVPVEEVRGYLATDSSQTMAYFI